MNNQDRNFQFTLKNVRCFAQEQHFDIRPLTFLVGENSTGKTTMMGCLSIIYDFINARGWRMPDFNKDPYFMGSFVDIVNKSNNQQAQFEMGIAHNKSNLKYNFHFIEREKGAEPIIDQASVDFKDMILSCKKTEQKVNITAICKKSNQKLYSKSRDISDNIHPIAWYILDPYRPHFYYPVEGKILFEKHQGKKILLKKRPKRKIFFEKLRELYSYQRRYFSGDIFSLAPVRSKPQRTYNPIKESSSSEGSEIPVTLMNLSNQSQIWEGIRKDLISFGESSGLFSDIKVKKYGGTTGDPFQLHFQVRGISSNMIDTGYGVSQILPLLVNLFVSNIEKQKQGTRFLLQQPEVHLHPKAQTALTSLFIQSIQSIQKNNSFLIETHSDYMLDRARIEIRKGNISPDQVSLIYLEPLASGVKVHNISFDPQGNLVGVPQGYRDFFIKESKHFLGFED